MSRLTLTSVKLFPEDARLLRDLYKGHGGFGCHIREAVRQMCDGLRDALAARDAGGDEQEGT